MAMITSAVSPKNRNLGRFYKDSKIEADMLHLREVINSRVFEKEYADAFTCASNIYFTTIGESQSLLGFIKKNFQGCMTRAIYVLILQDVVDTIVDDNFKTDFFKYNDLVEDKTDIKIEDNEYGSKLSVFNTIINLKIPVSGSVVDRSRIEELNYLVKKLGLTGFYYLLKALFKVAAVKRD